jgi:hypothetical protein
MTAIYPIPQRTSAESGQPNLIPTSRLTDLPEYVFAWLDELKASARKRGADLIDLGMGNPDQPTPQPIVDAIAAAYRIQRPQNARLSSVSRLAPFPAGGFVLYEEALWRRRRP